MGLFFFYFVVVAKTQNTPKREYFVISFALVFLLGGNIRARDGPLNSSLFSQSELIQCERALVFSLAIVSGCARDHC